MTVSNTASAIKLIHSLVTGGIDSATQLLASGGSIWLTNIVIFSLWFWEFDRGGPGARADRTDGGRAGAARNQRPRLVLRGA